MRRSMVNALDVYPATASDKIKHSQAQPIKDRTRCSEKGGGSSAASRRSCGSVIWPTTTAKAEAPKIETLKTKERKVWNSWAVCSVSRVEIGAGGVGLVYRGGREEGGCSRGAMLMVRSLKACLVLVGLRLPRIETRETVGGM